MACGGFYCMTAAKIETKFPMQKPAHSRLMESNMQKIQSTNDPLLALVVQLRQLWVLLDIYYGFSKNPKSHLTLANSKFRCKFQRMDWKLWKLFQSTTLSSRLPTQLPMMFHCDISKLEVWRLCLSKSLALRDLMARLFRLTISNHQIHRECRTQLSI